MMNNRRRVTFALILAVFTLFLSQACSDDTINSTTEKANEDQNSIANSINDFGYKLLKLLMNERKNQNVVISPTSIAGLLAMTLLGSVSNTYSEVANALGFSQDIVTNRMNHREFGELLQSLNRDVNTSKTLYADALYFDTQTQIRDAYRQYLSEVYHGDAIATDFRDAEKTKIVINEWVAEQTHNKIGNFLTEPLPTTTKLVLLSALYFSGQWKQPFSSEFTSPMLFKTPTKEVLTDLMVTGGNFHTYISRNKSLIMIALPYNDSVTTMYALKPLFPDKLSLEQLLNSLEYTTIDGLINRMKSKNTIVTFPKIDIDNDISLESSLKNLGINAMFDPLNANFALMVGLHEVNNIHDVNKTALTETINSLPSPGIHVDKVLHNVKISINEFGTEAAASTSGLLSRSPVLFYATSPYYIFIRNEKTKLVTFSAVIMDPTMS